MITVAGEALIDVLVAGSAAISAHPGGAPFNVARTVARLGGDVQFLGRVGDDAFGRRLRAALTDAGVHMVIADPTREPTTIALAELDADGVADYRFYLEGTSAGRLTAAELPLGLLDETDVIAFGGLGILVEPMATTLSTLVHAVSPDTTVLLDPNCRPRAIGDLAGYRESLWARLRRTDIVKVSVDDLALLAPEHDPRTAARGLLEHHPRAVLVTDGPRPVTIHTASAERTVPVPAVDLVDTVGAGDAFVAGLLTWWSQRGCRRSQSGDLDTLLAATQAAAGVAAAACTTAGADLPADLRWPGGAAGP